MAYTPRPIQLRKKSAAGLDDYGVLTFGLLLSVSHLSERVLGITLEELKFRQLVEWQAITGTIIK